MLLAELLLVTQASLLAILVTGTFQAVAYRDYPGRHSRIHAGAGSRWRRRSTRHRRRVAASLQRPGPGDSGTPAGRGGAGAPAGRKVCTRSVRQRIRPGWLGLTLKVTAPGNLNVTWTCLGRTESVPRSHPDSVTVTGRAAAGVAAAPDQANVNLKYCSQC